MKLKIMSFWSINAPLEENALNAQMDEMQRLGLDGVIFHPRFYPGKPDYLSKEYMDILSKIILHARQKGMEFWLYDEDGWPSGTAGGQVMSAHPEFRVRVLHEDLRISAEPGVSPIEAGAVDAFIGLTHQRYADMLDKEAFDYVTGFFTDEVGFGARGSASAHGYLPWCADMPERFRTRALFEDMPGCEEIRIEYWEYLTMLLQQRFYLPIRRWCDAHGKLYTGHLKGEENPYFQVSYSGSAMTSLKAFSLPGIDSLERYIPHGFLARLPVSLALQFGDGHAMCEAMAGSGWGTSPKDEEEYLLRLARMGIDTFIMHIQQFKLDEKSMTDWPPSRPCDLTWSEVYPEMVRRLKKKAEKINPWKAADALVVIPARGAMAGFVPKEALVINDHNGEELPDTAAGRESISLLALTDMLENAGWTYDLTDEATFEQEAAYADGCVSIGRRIYKNVLFATGARVKNSVRSTPAQSEWRIVGFEGERRIPSACRKKDNRHFLCSFEEKRAAQKNNTGNLIASGYGFCRSVTLEKQIMLPENMPACIMLLTGIDAAAAVVSIDGGMVGYAYGDDWSVELPEMAAGMHIISVQLINSGFNVHGPHHYYLGDFRLTSPLHLKGVKHFGDQTDAPENTHIAEWHFVNYRLFGAVHLIDKAIRSE